MAGKPLEILMPLYTYECTCEHTLEIHHSINEDPEIECPTCETNMQRRIGNIGGIRFNGTGFYSTDQGGRG